MAFNIAIKSKTAEASFSVYRNYVCEFLDAASHIVPKRTSIAILKMVRICVSSGNGYMRVSDMECYADLTLEGLTGSGDIDLAVNYADLKALMLKASRCNMLIEREGNTLTFRDSCTTYGKLEGVPGIDFPAFLIPMESPKDSISLTQPEIMYTDKFYSPLCTKDPQYTALSGIFLGLSGKEYCFVSSDRHMLLCTNRIKPEHHYVLPTTAIKALAEYGTEATLDLYDDYFKFRCPNIVVYGKLIKGTYPQYWSLFYINYVHEHKVNVGKLRSELNRVLSSVPKTHKDTYPVMLTYGDDYLGVTEVPEDYDFNKGVGIKMDGKRILELLERFGDNSDVSFMSSDVIERPTIWQDSKATTLFMGIR